MERLDKLVATHCCIPRKEARSLIRRGLVTVSGDIVRTPDGKCPDDARITVEGKELNLAPHCYLMLNKPKGVLSATRDRRVETVLDLVPAELCRKGLFPAGRLDKDTEGLLLITDDGAFAHRILSPKRHVPKTYHAVVDKGADFAGIAVTFGEGMYLGDGDRVSPAELKVLEAGNAPLLEVTIYEGVYHQIKRMFQLCGLEVLALRRVSIGGLQLDLSLAPGACRALTQDEVESVEHPFVTI